MSQSSTGSRTAQRTEINTLGMRTRAWAYGASHCAPLILVHGFRGDHHGLEGLAVAASALAPELRIVVPDLPGFGESPAVPDREHNLELYGEWLCQFAAEVSELSLIHI